MFKRSVHPAAAPAYAAVYGPPALMIAGAAISAAGTVASGVAQRRAAEFNARMSQENALLERQKAEREERLFRQRGEKLKGSQRAAIAKSGVTTAGSPLDVLAETAADLEDEALTIRFGGQLRERRFKQQAALQRFEGRQAQTASVIDAGGSLLTATGSALK